MAGLNTKIKYKGASIDVQTQDKGAQAQYVETFIYKSGKIVFSQKSYYTQFIEEKNLKEKITQIMEEQHYTILNKIYGGEFDRYLLQGKS